MNPLWLVLGGRRKPTIGNGPIPISGLPSDPPAKGLTVRGLNT